MFTNSEKRNAGRALENVLTAGEPQDLDEARDLLLDAQYLHLLANQLAARAGRACADFVGVDVEAETEEFLALAFDSRGDLFGPIEARVHRRSSYMEAAE